ncbi:MAG: flagellar protein FlaG [Betaproteobacteria bacterium]|nr:flagellar protein FlaG [Betaproteobacteria bacterium]
MKLGPIGTAPPPGATPEGAAPAAAVPRHSPGIATPGAAPTAAQLQGVVDRLNEALQALPSDVKLEFDPQARETVVRVVDRRSNAVIGQIPSQDALELARALNRVQGLLVSARA